MSANPLFDQLHSENLRSLQAQLAADIEALREKEQNLNAYEQRLRSLVEQTASRSALGHVAVAGETVEGLAASWEKHRRSQALLEAERRAFKDERLIFREQAEALRLREQEFKQRELWATRTESEAAAVSAVPVISAARRSLTTAPFRAVKRIFSGSGD